MAKPRGGPPPSTELKRGPSERRRSSRREFLEGSPADGWTVVGIIDDEWVYELTTEATGAGLAVRGLRMFPMGPDVRRRELVAAVKAAKSWGVENNRPTRAERELEEFERTQASRPPDRELPRGGLKAQHLRRISLRSSEGLFVLNWENEVARKMKSNAARAGRPGEAKSEKRSSQGPPRQRRTADFIADVAARYSRAIKADVWKPNVVVARELGTTREKIRDAVRKAREMGLLGPAIAQGKRGWQERPESTPRRLNEGRKVVRTGRST